MYDLREKKLHIGENLKFSWQVFKENFITILLLTLITAIPISIINSYLPGEGLFKMPIHIIITVVGISELLALVAVITDLAIIYLTAEYENGVRMTFRAALSKSLSTLLPALGTEIIGVVGILLGLIALVIPGIALFIFFSFRQQAVVLKGLIGTRALKYSYSLVKGNWWRLFVLTLAFIIVKGLLTQELQKLFSIFGIEFLTSTLSDSISSVLSSFFTIFITILFLNLDYRKKAIEETPGNIIV